MLASPDGGIKAKREGMRTIWSRRASMLRGFMTSVLNWGCRKESRMRLCSSSLTCDIKPHRFHSAWNEPCTSMYLQANKAAQY